MDSFDTLLEKGNYDLIIKSTNSATDADSLFYRIIAFASSLKFKEALDVLLKFRNVLEEKNMKLTIQLHIDVLILLQDFDAAFEEYAYYKERPYVSQEVEEVLKSLPKYIREKEKESYIPNKKDLSSEQIKNILKSSSTEEVLFAFDNIKNSNINLFIDEILYLIKEHPNQSIRTFALLLLVNYKYNSDVAFTSQEGLIHVNPSKLNPPFEDENFVKCSEFLTENNKNVTLSNNAIQLLSSLLIMIYPKIITADDVLSLVAIRELSKKYLHIESNLDEECNKNNLNYNELENKILKFDTILSKF